MNQNGPHSMAEQKCFEFVLSHKYDRLNGLKGHTTSHEPKWGENGSAHKSEKVA